MSIAVPNEYLGNEGFIGLAPETAFGTPATSTTWLPFKSETLVSKPNIKNIPTIRGSRSEYTSKFTGLYEISGDIVYPFYPTSGIILLAAALGKDTYATATHALAVSDGAIPSLTVEKYLGGVTDATIAGAASRQFAGMLVSKWALKLAIDAEAEATATFMGQQDTFIAPSTPSYGADTTPYSLLNISATIDTVAAPFITAIDLSIDNSAKALGTFQGTRFPALVYATSRKVDGTITVAMQNTALLLDAFAGGYHAFAVTLSQDSTHSAVFTMTHVVLGDTTEEIKMGDIVMQQIPFTAYAIPGSTDLSVTVKNDAVAAYFG